MISVTEGTDKPLKYPHMFAAAGLVIVNKTDLLPYVDFDLEACRRLRPVGEPDVEILPVSATTGEGVRLVRLDRILREQLEVAGMSQDR